jgi:hypothetical protein
MRKVTYEVGLARAVGVTGRAESKEVVLRPHRARAHAQVPDEAALRGLADALDRLGDKAPPYHLWTEQP